MISQDLTEFFKVLQNIASDFKIFKKTPKYFSNFRIFLILGNTPHTLEYFKVL